MLNANFSDIQVDEFDKINGEIVNFLSSYTNIPYKEKVHWVQAYMTANETGYFAFASNPTFTICGNSPSDLRATFDQQLKGGFLSTIVHELSHYYFGTLKKCNNTLENLINEGFAQFLAFKYISQFKENDYIENGIREGLEWIGDPNFKHKAMLDFIKLENTNDRQTYAYDYQTTILFSIEKEIGDEKMKQWIRLLLQREECISNKAFFETTLKKAVNNNELYNKIVQKYLTGDSTVENMKILWGE